MATKKTLDTLVEAANMIEKTKGEQNNKNQELYLPTIEPGSSGKDSDEFESVRNASRLNHNVLERNRRAQMRDNFNLLQDLLPTLSGHKKASNVSILKEATGVIRKLQSDDMLYQSEKARLVKYKECLKAKLRLLKDSYQLPQLNMDNLLNESTNDERPMKKAPGHVTRFDSTSDVAVNTDLSDGFDTEDENVTWGQDYDELHIEIDD